MKNCVNRVFKILFNFVIALGTRKNHKI